MSGSELMDEAAIDLGIEGKIKLFEGLEFTKCSGFGAPGDAASSSLKKTLFNVTTLSKGTESVSPHFREW